MDRRRLIAAIILTGVATGLCLARIDAHGFWFDEAYTARVAALPLDRLVRGALLDVHPPGWPLIVGVFLRLPLPAEVAARLPSTLAFGVLVGLLSSRHVLLGSALLLAAPVLDQATQGRPYILLALALVLTGEALRRERWGWAGLATGLAASLHAVGAVLAAPMVLVALVQGRPPLRMIARFGLAALGIVAWWLPSFLANASVYLQHPWYTPSDAARWWTLTDGPTGLVGLMVLVAFQVRDGWRRLAPALAVPAVLFLLEALGVGLEVRKTGIVVLPLILAAVEPRGRALGGVAALVVGLGFGSVRIDERPDLREARAAVDALPSGIPVVSVFASESAWYLRTPAPLASRLAPSEVRGRLAEVMAAQQADCTAAIQLPGGFPAEADLEPELRTVARATVTGLDVRLLGHVACTPEGLAHPWVPVLSLDP